MPYVPEPREDLHPHSPCVAANPGELNYQFTALLVDYLAVHGLSYRTINDVVGSLEGAKLEFYRRTAAPYEARKCQENGDVY